MPNIVVKQEIIEKKIYLIRGTNVMLDKDLAELYGVETRVLIQAVKRNIERFPEDFMFQLTKEEFENLKSQIVTSSWRVGVIYLMLSQNKVLLCFQVYFIAKELFR